MLSKLERMEPSPESCALTLEIKAHKVKVDALAPLHVFGRRVRLVFKNLSQGLAVFVKPLRSLSFEAFT